MGQYISRVSALAVTALLAGCQAFPAVQGDLQNWGLGALTGRAGGAAPQAGANPATGTTGKQLVTDPYAGQGVKQPSIPTGGKVAPTATTPATTATTVPARTASTHTVAAGETAWSIARKYGVSVQDLSKANGLSEAMSVRVGQRLTIPGATATGTSDASAPGAGTPTPTPPSASKPLPDEKTEPASAPAPKTDAPDLGKTRTAASGSGKFQMPVAGSIVNAYSQGSNEGIDISAPAGTSVKAAGGGRVAAVTRDTDNVPIIVVRHDGDLMTVYSGMDKVSVQKGDSVSKGQTLGTSSAKGRVHFEVRRGFDSVNPEDYL